MHRQQFAFEGQLFGRFSPFYLYVEITPGGIYLISETLPGLFKV